MIATLNELDYALCMRALRMRAHRSGEVWWVAVSSDETGISVSARSLTLAGAIIEAIRCHDSQQQRARP